REMTMSLVIPSNPQSIPDSDISRDPSYKGLAIVRYQSDSEARRAYDSIQFDFQRDPAPRTPMLAVISRKGAPSDYRIVASLHPTLLEFVNLVRYDPSEPPIEDYDAHGMRKAH